MSESSKKNRVPQKKEGPASKDDQRGGKTPNEKQSDSDDVERAVYDGMQDLRVKRPG